MGIITIHSFKQAALLLSMAVLVMSCAKSDIESEAPDIGGGVTLIAKASTHNEAQTRMGYHGGSTSMTFTWEDDTRNGNTVKESFSAFVQGEGNAPGSNMPVVFVQTDNGGNNNGTFSANFESSPSDGTELYAIYPELKSGATYAPEAVSLDLTTQKLATTEDALKHNKSHYMWAKSVYTGSGDVNFSFKHKVSILKVDLMLPAGTDPIKQVKLAGLKAKANLNVTSGEIDFTGIAEQESIVEDAVGIHLTDNKLTAYIFVFEQDATTDILKLTATDASGVSYEVKFTGRPIDAGKVYTLTKTLAAPSNNVETWEEGSTNDVISKEVKPGYGPGDLKIGDYYYSDDQWSDGGYRQYTDGSTTILPRMPELKYGWREVIGIVYWVGNIAGDNYKLLDTKFPSGTRGLVVSLQDLKDPGDQTQSRMFWTYGGSGSVSDWLKDATWTGEVARPTDFQNVQEESMMNGYANRLALKEYNKVKEGGIDSIEKVKPIVALSHFSTANPSPFYSTGWYWPSIAELKIMCWGQGASEGVAGKELLNAQFQKTGGTKLGTSTYYCYWSSTEYSISTQCWSVNFDNGNVSNTGKTTDEFLVRPVLAF